LLVIAAYHSGDQKKEGEMGGGRDTLGGEEKLIKYFGG